MKSPIHMHLTTDGSPTLSFGEKGEWMHHREGAFSESLYVYGEALSRVENRGQSVSVLVVGLGLGYLELLTVATALSRGWANWRVMTFESDPLLREQFVRWVIGAGVTTTKLAAAYDAILLRTAAQFDVAPEVLRNSLALALEEGRWRLKEALVETSEVDFPCDAILFDPFSAETTPALWADAFLRDFLTQSAAPHCIFATYSAKGSLKRLLESQRFTVDNRSGFGGKRECTLARR